MRSNFKICTSLGYIDTPEILSILGKVEMAELRLDLLKLSGRDLKTIFGNHDCLIATCRRGLYGDEYSGKLLEEAAKAGAAYINIDVEGSGCNGWEEKMTDIARKNSCKVIYSYHCSTHTPTINELKQLANSMISVGADIVKIETKTISHIDNSNLLSLYSTYENLVVIGIGGQGVITRIAAPFLGAPFTFVSYENGKTAPWQIDYFEMKDILEWLISNEKCNIKESIIAKSIKV